MSNHLTGDDLARQVIAGKTPGAHSYTVDRVNSLLSFADLATAENLRRIDNYVTMFFTQQEQTIFWAAALRHNKELSNTPEFASWLLAHADLFQ